MRVWIKLWLEILSDYKMWDLSDRLWRRVVECFLIAGTVGDDDPLPSLEQMAWTLRMRPEELEKDLLALQERGLVALKDGRWRVPKFAKRQAPMSGAERTRRWRERGRDENVTAASPKRHHNVTNAVTKPVTKTVQEEKRREEKERREEKRARPPPGDAEKAWANCLDELKLTMTRLTFDTHLGGCKLTEVVDDVWRVKVRDPYAADWLEHRWQKRIDDRLSSIAGRPVRVEFWAEEGVKY